MSRHKPLAEEVKAITEFAGIVNTKSTKDIGHKALTLATNVEVTDTKKLVRRAGFTLLDAAAFTGIYGTEAQDHLYAVRTGSLTHYDADFVATVLASGLAGDVYTWSEDPNNNVYFTSNRGANGIITNDVTFLPLSLPIPDILSAGVVDPGTWEYRPFNLGASYTANTMQVMATYAMDDGRESAPCETVSIEVTPEVRMIRVTVPPLPAGVFHARIYATAPGGSTYYLIAITANQTVTIPVSRMNMSATGVQYEFPLSCVSFPSTANLLCFYGGVLYATAYDAAADQGVVYASLPLQYHLFDMAEDFFAVSSFPLLLLPFKDGIIIGTSTNIYKYTPEHRKVSGAASREVLTEVANYGVIPGGCGDVVNGEAYFWTRRGIAKAFINDRGNFEYQLVTQEHFAGDPGVFNSAHLFHDRGYIKLVASTLSGNKPFNIWSER